MARILSKRDLSLVTRLFVVEAPLVARNACPGQFVILRVSETGERVPISLTDFDAAAGTVTIVVQEVGKTSAMICALEPGDEILDFAGPLGLPAPLPPRGKVVLIGGGFGAGAVYPLARELRRRHVGVEAIVGARTKHLLILRDKLASTVDACHVCTDDGSIGHRGFVTDRLEELIAGGAGYTHCFAVGPMPSRTSAAAPARIG